MSQENETVRKTVITDEHRQALKKARIDMMGSNSLVFFTTIIMNMEQYWDTAVEDFQTDGLSYTLNPDYFLSLNKPERVYVLGQIAMHTGYYHPARMEDREKDLWERSTANAVNLQLKDRKLKAYKGAEAQDRFKGMSAEEIYRILRKEKDNGGGGPAPNHLASAMAPASGSGDSSVDNEGNSKSNKPQMSQSDVESAISDMVQQAVTQAQMVGDPGAVPGDIQLLLDQIHNTKLPWNVILQRWMNRFDKTDYSFRKPNRRFMPEFYLPSLWGEAMITLAIAVDISGSVSDDDFKYIISHVAKILQTVKPDKIELIQFDTKIQGIDTITSVDQLYKVDFHGRGGTDVSCILDWADTHKPEGLIFFSDGGFYHPRDKCKHDTLWLTHDNPHFTAPYGKVIHYEMPHNAHWRR